MTAAKDEHPIEAFSAHRLDEPLRERVGTRGANGRADDPDALCLEYFVKGRTAPSCRSTTASMASCRHDQLLGVVATRGSAETRGRGMTMPSPTLSASRTSDKVQVDGSDGVFGTHRMFREGYDPAISPALLRGEVFLRAAGTSFPRNVLRNTPAGRAMHVLFQRDNSNTTIMRDCASDYKVTVYLPTFIAAALGGWRRTGDSREARKLPPHRISRTPRSPSRMTRMTSFH
jgi:hypothetical protein